MDIGARLRQVRKEHKLSISEVTQETKIQPWVLEALEADRLQELMSPIYVKGFLMTYARFLELAPEPLLAQLPKSRAEAEEELFPASDTLKIPVALHVSWPLVQRLAIAGAAVAVVVGIIAVNPFARLSRMSPSTAVEQASIAPVGQTIVRPSTSELATAVETLQALELSIIAHRTTWIQVRADGKLVAQQQLRRGDEERWTAKHRFELIIARPDHVELKLNNQSISPFAIANRGRLAITRAGVTPLTDE